MLIWQCLELISDVPPIDGVPPWLSALLGAMPTTGILAWFLYHITAVRWPIVEAAHAKERESAEERHAANITLLITNFRNDVTAIWAEQKKGNMELAQAIRELSGQIDKNNCKFTGHAPHHTSG